METIKADDVVQHTLLQANLDASKALRSEVLVLRAPMLPGVDDVVRDEVEGLHELEDSSSSLAVILETEGGYIETVQRLVDVFRRHYSEVSFVIPSYAYSAGTVLALSGDEIYMDYYSVLGPIDPQFETEDGDRVPGMGYLAKYQELVDEINATDAGNEAAVRGQIAFLLKKFDPAKLFQIEQAVEHSKSLLREWLPKYKFKNWESTETRCLPVTQEYKEGRAKQIADMLGDAGHWHSHGRGISMRELGNEAIGLKVRDFGAEPALSHSIRHYYSLFNDYTQKLGMRNAVHSRRKLRTMP